MSVGEYAKALRELLCSGAGGMQVHMKTTAAGIGCLSCFFGQQYLSNICGWTVCYRQKLQGYINSGIVKDTLDPNSLCVETCQLCKNIPNKIYCDLLCLGLE